MRVHEGAGGGVVVGEGGSGGMLPREILKFSFSKMHILHILTENYRKNEPNLTVNIACV